MSQWASSDHVWKSKRDLAILEDRRELGEFIAEMEKHGYEDEAIEKWRFILSFVGQGGYEPGDWQKMRVAMPSDQLKAAAAAVQNGEGSAEALAQLVFDYFKGALKPHVVEG